MQITPPNQGVFVDEAKRAVVTIFLSNGAPSNSVVYYARSARPAWLTAPRSAERPLCGVEHHAHDHDCDHQHQAGDAQTHRLEPEPPH